MNYFVLIFAYMLSMVHTFVPHHHHDVSENPGHVSVDAHSFHDHDQHHHHHSESDHQNSQDQGKSGSPYSHILSPIDGSVYLENQSGISIEKTSQTDVTAILVTTSLTLPSFSNLKELLHFTSEQISLNVVSGSCGLRAPPIS